MEKKGIIMSLPMNIHELEEPFPICIYIKVAKITSSSNINVSKFAPGFMPQMDLNF